MTHPASPYAPAFRRLRRALLARRLRRLDAVLGAELTLIAVLAAAGVAWQARLPLDHLARTHGPGAAAAALAAALLATLAAAAAIAAGDHAGRLLRPLAGPEWLALPLPPVVVARQVAWESELRALVVLPVILGLLAATLALVPGRWLALLALGTAALLVPAARLGATLARGPVVAWAARRGASRADAALRSLFETARHARVRRLAPARWGTAPAHALLRKDLARSLRRTPARRPAVVWAALLLLAVALGLPPLEPATAGALAAGLAVVAAAALAEWMIALSAGDPYDLLAALPLSARRVWAVRGGIVAAATVLAATLVALAAHRLAATAREQLAAALALATLLIGLLGVTYGVTLFPRVETAHRLVLLWLGLALAASVMFPLAGWLVLLGALVHALRRLRARATLQSDAVPGEV